MRRLSVVVALFIVAAAGCGGGTDEKTTATSTPRASFSASSTMGQIKAKGKLVVGVKADIPQFGFRNPTADRFEGFDVDMGAEIAKAIGVQPEYVEAVSANRIPFLQQDKVDIVFSTMTVTDERKQQIDFSDVYYVAGQDFLYKKGTPVTVTTASGKTICTAKGSTSAKNLPLVSPGVKVQELNTYSECFQLLRNGQINAVSTDDVILLQFVKQDPQFQISGKPFSREPYGAGIKKGRTDFVQFVDGVIRAMKRDGRWARLYRTWITAATGKQPPSPPPVDVRFEIFGLASPSPSAAPSPAASP
jgi:ABC-type amino acid transport substrate-binding protein